ncbi:hypothetical protein B9Z65_2298 [Elsinoe australis]|uniref:Uncharacterized protein n=1 Tax=Elsinoe australis TaxID=40998 RepID=A0A2P7ZAB9_9PEZI|nr:hypothetical protein B9Z65_2298 [Elsinoe australis]
MKRLGLSEPLPAAVRKKYEIAGQSGALIFSDTQVTILQPDSWSPASYQLRYCPALEKKPTQKKPEQQDNKSFDPFENPSPDLLITEVPLQNPTHLLVLNKYPIIHQHFILATKDYAKQTDLLEPDDLATTYAVLKAWEDDGGGKLFAFFNSGLESGASQPHRHVQFVPVDEMRRDVPEARQWKPIIENDLIGEGTSLPGLPMKIQVAKASPETLYDTYVRLLTDNVGIEEVETSEGKSKRPSASYNLAMTTDRIAIAKRTREAYIYQDDSREDHPIALNGTVLAGTLMVKGQTEWNWLKNEPSNLLKVLQAIGEPVDFQRGQQMGSTSKLT